MSDFKVALAPGQLTQTINPWSWTMGDFSFFTVNLGQSGDPGLEAQVLGKVGSYGRQLGRLGEAMTVLLDHLELKDLKPHEKAAIRALKRQLEEIADLRTERRSGQQAASLSA
ncbi:MAG TPA: hypothetical protein VHN39_13030 [Phenylobacterium sp.]|jgi:hypothetical protein|nr:hypothetical protein [Phenylobacterium sp.]